MTDYPSEMHDLSLLNTEELNLNLDNLQFLNVVQVDTSQYTGPVFDLEIETNHNYQVSALGFAHNGGKRPGSFAPYLETWHGDLLSFIDLKRNTGDERYRTYELFPACYVNDLFMKRKFADEMWSFFSPYDCPLLVDSYGEEFEKNYLQYEAEGKAITQLPAREVWRKMLTSLSETGAPWITFKDPINERNPQKHVGMVHSSNLCFPAETMVAVADGRNAVSIKQLVEEYETTGNKFPVYSGQKAADSKRTIGRRGGGYTELTAWTPVIKNATAFKTRSSEIVKVTLSNGDTFRCTPDHKLFTVYGEKVEAQNSVGLEIEPFFSYTGRNQESPYRHINSLSNVGQKQHIMMYNHAYPESLEFKGEIDHIDTSVDYPDVLANLQKLSFADHMTKWSKEMSESNPMHKVNKEYISGVRRAQMSGVGNNTSTGIDNFELIRLVREEWLKDTDKKPIDAYREVQKTTHLPSSFSKYRFGGGKEGWSKFFSYITGDLVYGGEYDVTIDAPLRSDYYTDNNSQRIEYINTHFREEKGDTLIQKGLTVVSVVNDGEEDVYCLNVEDTHTFYIITSTEDDKYLNCQGVLVSNCTEITLNTSANDEVAVCNLGSINAAKFPTDPEERKAHIKRVVKYTHRALDNVIDINYYPHDRARKSNLRHRPIGYGIMGYTEFLVKSGIDWESEAHVEMADNLFEELSYEILSSSVGLAKEKGAYSTFEGSDWSKGILPIHTAKDQSTKLGMETWDALAKEIVTHGLRNSNHMAIAPTATIGNLIGTTACIEPVFEKVYTEEIKSGYFQVTDPCLAYGRPSLCKYAFNIAPQWVIKAAARRQKWIDQSQSLNLFIPKVVTYDDLDETYSYAWLAGLKTTYYLHREQQSYQSRTKQSESKPVDVSSMTEEEREEYEMQQAIEAAKSDLAQQGALKTSFHNISCEGCQ